MSLISSGLEKWQVWGCSVAVPGVVLFQFSTLFIALNVSSYYLGEAPPKAEIFTTFLFKATQTFVPPK
jgi:hypothetical protein